MIRRLNHAVLWVSDARRSATFYTDVLGFTVAATLGEHAVFLRAAESLSDHDLGLFSVGADHGAGPRRAPGLYHLAWEVGSIDELAAVRATLFAVGALTGESDHGVSKSVYGCDPDGIEFEVLWVTPRETWPSTVFTAPLDLPAELDRWSGTETAA